MTRSRESTSGWYMADIISTPNLSRYTPLSRWHDRTQARWNKIHRRISNSKGYVDARVIWRRNSLSWSYRWFTRSSTKRQQMEHHLTRYNQIYHSIRDIIFHEKNLHERRSTNCRENPHRYHRNISHTNTHAISLSWVIWAVFEDIQLSLNICNHSRHGALYHCSTGDSTSCK